jgi:hypothetical protein
MKLISNSLIGLVRLYQYVISPLMPPHCRFYPSCSHYACDAFREHGPLHGGRLTLLRLLRCHPWGGEGYDPVPQAESRVHADPTAAASGRGLCHHHFQEHH